MQVRDRKEKMEIFVTALSYCEVVIATIVVLSKNIHEFSDFSSS